MPRKKSKNRVLVYSLLLLIITYAVAFSIAFAIGPSHMGDDIAYSFLAHYAAIGTFQENAGNILAVRPLQVFPIGFFYAVFGAGTLTSTAWNIISLSLSILLVFLIGRELYNNYVGLLAALLLAFFPMAAVYSLTMSDNIPMMFFVNLAVFCLIKAIRKRSSKLWYFIAGAAIALPPFTIPEGFILWIIVGLYLLIEIIRRKLAVNMTTIAYLYGFAVMMGLMLLLNYVNSGDPLITFTANIAYYGQTSRPDLIPLPINTALAFYPNIMFPYHILGNLLNPVDIANSYSGNTDLSGFYFYALIISAAYLLFLRDKRLYLPLFWVAVGVLYLEFGPQHINLSPFTYVLSHRLDRYLTLVAAPLAIIIAAALEEAIKKSKKKWKLVKIWLSSASIVFLVLTSIPIILLVQGTAYATQYTELQAAGYLNSLPNSTMVYLDSGLGDLVVYMHFDNMSRFKIDYGGLSSCTQVPSNSFVLVPRYFQQGFLTFANTVPQCTYWKLVMAPQISSFPAKEQDPAKFALSNLYYVTANSIANQTTR